MTAGDAASNGYKMVGLADGTGAFDNNDGTFTMLINHEISSSLGVPRLHGKKGAFVSKWIIDKKTFEVTKGQEVTPVPLGPKEVAGFFNLRGQIVTAINMRVRLGLPTVDHGSDALSIFFQDQDHLFALLVRNEQKTRLNQPQPYAFHP
jgi:hypothetical protein